MKKINNNGFVLLETLIVTTFLASVLIFLLIQFNNLNRNYQDSYNYNTVEDLYALEDIANYIEKDREGYLNLKDSLNSYIDISDCSYFTNPSYCEKLLQHENIDILIMTTFDFDKSKIVDYDDDFIDFVNKINPKGSSKYRLIAKFKNNSFATLRFGDEND